jgi:hypothetical protein
VVRRCRQCWAGKSNKRREGIPVLAELPDRFRRPRDLAQLIREIRRYLRSRQRTPALVAPYFHERHVTYAAAPTH